MGTSGHHQRQEFFRINTTPLYLFSRIASALYLRSGVSSIYPALSVCTTASSVWRSHCSSAEISGGGEARSWSSESSRGSLSLSLSHSLSLARALLCVTDSTCATLRPPPGLTHYPRTLRVRTLIGRPTIHMSHSLTRRFGT